MLGFAMLESFCLGWDLGLCDVGTILTVVEFASESVGLSWASLCWNGLAYVGICEVGIVMTLVGFSMLESFCLC
jgi:hypothetical protein